MIADYAPMWRPVIALPAAAAVIAAICAAIVGWDALRRPRPERVIWAGAFLLFMVAAACEVIGSATGWSPILARVYYLTGAVLVVGVLALGELYFLLPGRMPAITPGVSLLIVAVSATAVWSAPIDWARLPTAGWQALERGPFLVALAATLNAGGTIVLTGGALYSAWKLRAAGGSGQPSGWMRADRNWDGRRCFGRDTDPVREARVPLPADDSWHRDHLFRGRSDAATSVGTSDGAARAIDPATDSTPLDATCECAWGRRSSLRRRAPSPPG